MQGKQVRLSRILDGGKAVIIPMDHGITLGPVKGLANFEETVNKVVQGGATAVLFHKGIIRNMKQPPGPNCGLIMHVSANTRFASRPDFKVTVASVKQAVRLGVDAVSTHTNVGGTEEEPLMLEMLGTIADACEEFQIPLLAMMYPRGPNVSNGFDPEVVAHVARVGAELGADIIKTNYTGDPDSFQRVTKGCPVPIVIAGGPKAETEREALEMVKGAMEGGAIGVSIGRNCFQHENPTTITRAISTIVKEDASVEEALKLL
ncbi:MAG: 2-amino-3,7-dideoxy-D-threo-hept-6-ulosonate synthase [Candidatus Heimdallarchaeota archaeon]